MTQMIEENGQVVKVGDDGFVWVETLRKSSCGACADREGCGTSVLASVLGQRQAPVRVINSIGAAAGDRVVIGVSEYGLLRGSLAVYAVPLAALFIGALAGHYLGDGGMHRYADLLDLSGAAAGFTAGLAWLKRFSRVTGRDGRYQPVILRRQMPVRSPGHEIS
jgi:sigma-E factor negative regulatory protein RseC